MKKTLAKLLILTLVATNVSVLSTSVVKASDANKTNISLKSEGSYDDTIINKGSVLTYSDFHEISEKVSKLEGNNEEVTDTYIKKLIVEKIENKISNPSRTKRSYSIFGRKVTGEELALVSAFPKFALKAFDDAKTAEAETSRRYQSSTRHLGNGDAFRHTYWNGLMVYSIGEGHAEAFANAHESETPDGADKTMDLNNNAVGRRLGTYTNTKSELLSEVIRYCDNGWLHRIVNGELADTDSSGKK